ncbi:chitin deacetylase 7 [Hyalella azteca]|uniref:Chitin deacetylase 7 n=1 Tax=Hyalella azteca TaxID=294128 RepID=A0A8B7P528_HYAAZ|nr:chitin deacetylase 7 [Hyalella azteca]
MHFAVLLALFSVAAAEVAGPCDEADCALPTCACSSTATPGGLAVASIPHFVVFSFDDGVTVTNIPFYRELQKRTNPNGCGIEMTFFVSHENSDYTLVNELYRNGHEIAVHSVTHKSDVGEYWRKLNQSQWLAEIEQQREMLNTYGKIPVEKIKGFRAPFLEVGGDSMFGALKEAGFDYDCSWPSLQYTPWFRQPDGSYKGALWPYTLDYASIQDQTVGVKPTESFPGLWVSPMTDLQDNRGFECSMLDACQSSPEGELETSSEAVFDLLKRNFRSHYNTRTPFGIYTHHSWFYNETRKDGLRQFLDYLKAFPHVYVVSVRQLLDWVRSPVPLSQLGTMSSFQCGQTLADNCPDKKNCQYNAPLPISNSEIYMKICNSNCPPNYPYLDNVDGSKPYS